MYDFQLNKKRAITGDSSKAASINRESVVATVQNPPSGELVAADSVKTVSKRKRKKNREAFTGDSAAFILPLAGYLLFLIF